MPTEYSDHLWSWDNPESDTLGYEPVIGTISGSGAPGADNGPVYEPTTELNAGPFVPGVGGSDRGDANISTFGAPPADAGIVDSGPGSFIPAVGGTEGENPNIGTFGLEIGDFDDPPVEPGPNASEEQYKQYIDDFIAYNKDQLETEAIFEAMEAADEAEAEAAMRKVKIEEDGTADDVTVSQFWDDTFHFGPSPPAPIPGLSLDLDDGAFELTATTSGFGETDPESLTAPTGSSEVSDPFANANPDGFFVGTSFDDFIL